MDNYMIKAIETIKNRIEYYQVRIEAWESVERLRKKDGSDFAILSKNFKNATLLNEYGSNKIRVYFHTDKNGYESDDIYLNANVYIGLEAAKTPDDIESRIKYQIDQYKHWLIRANKALETIENTLAGITPILDQLSDVIDQGKKDTDTNYIIQQYIKDYLHILND